MIMLRGRITKNLDFPSYASSYPSIAFYLLFPWLEKSHNGYRYKIIPIPIVNNIADRMSGNEYAEQSV